MRKAKILGEDGVPLQTTRQRKRSYLDGSFKLKKDGLRNEDLASLGAKIANLGLEQLDLLARSAAPHFQEAIDYRVKVDFVLVRHCKYSSILTSLRLWRTQKKKKDRVVGSDRQIPGSQRQDRKKNGERAGKPER